MSLIIIIISFNIPSGSYILHAVIALMHDFVNRTKFTTNSRLREIFSTSGTFVLFSREFFLSLLHWEFSMIKSAICILKGMLGGEICSADVIVMHKGYYSEWYTHSASFYI